MKDTFETGLGSSKVLSTTDSPITENTPQKSSTLMTFIIVPLMLLFSSAIMATAWLGHLRFKEDLTFWMATLLAWMLVLPEYALNIKALRLGYQKFTGGQMGAFRLCTGIACIAFVSHYVLDEQLTIQKLVGFAVMTLSMVLISGSKSQKEAL